MLSVFASRIIRENPHMLNNLAFHSLHVVVYGLATSANNGTTANTSSSVFEQQLAQVGKLANCQLLL
mgnify:CR=1 FL=1|jgi:hypothetical protein